MTSNLIQQVNDSLTSMASATVGVIRRFAILRRSSMRFAAEAQVVEYRQHAKTAELELENALRKLREQRQRVDAAWTDSLKDSK